jgi:hypothetical protein
MLKVQVDTEVRADGTVSFRMPKGVKPGIHRLVVMVQDVAPAYSNKVVEPPQDVVGNDEEAEAAAYKAVYKAAGGAAG